VKSDKELRELRGPVKEVTVRKGYISIRDGRQVEQCCSFLVRYTYDETGTLTKQESAPSPYGDDFVGRPQVVPKYDERGKLMEEERRNADGTLVSKAIYIYDSRGNKSQVVRRRADGSIYYREVFTYNKAGYLTEHTSYYGDGSPASKAIYSDHDAEGNWLKEVRHIGRSTGGRQYFEPYLVYHRVISYYKR
jgi:hypothetical protein